MPRTQLIAIGRSFEKFMCTACGWMFCYKKHYPRDPDEVVRMNKRTVMEDWDKHLQSAHPKRWEREQRKRARRLKNR